MTNLNSTIELTFSSQDWRTRFLVMITADLKDEFFGIRENIIRVLPQKKVHKPYYVLEVFVRKDHFNELKQVAFYSIDIINEFLSQVSVISYSSCELIKMISTAPHMVKTGEPFEMVLYEGNYSIKTIDISKDDIKLYSDQSPKLTYVNLLTILKDAINTESLELKFLNFFTALDYIAQEETTQRVNINCPNYGHQIPSQLATSNFLLELFQNNGIEKKKYNIIRSLRSKIAHGSGIRNSQFYEDIRAYLPSLESLALQEVSHRTGILIKRNSNLVWSLPFLNLTCVKTFNTKWSIPSMFKVKDASWSAQAAFTAIKNATSDSSRLSGEFGPGMDLRNLKINRLAWPN